MKKNKDLFKICPKTGRIIGFKNRNSLFTLLFVAIGFLSLVWFLIRVIPKPSRANYPCMKATMPVAYSFIAYIIGLSGSLVFFRKAMDVAKMKRFRYATFFIFISLAFGIWGFMHNNNEIKANVNNTKLFSDPLGPNHPIGIAKGIFPGRVVWIFDLKSTNQNCVPYNFGDGYFLDKNCDQTVVSDMVSKSIKSLTGKDDETQAWDAIFKFYNKAHQKGEVGYATGEKIFIKINSVNAWTTDNNGDPNDDGSYGTVNTSPQVVFAVLDELVNKAGIPQNMISVGDPFTQMFNCDYNKYKAKFPNVTYIVHSAMTGRTVATTNSPKTIYFSDKGTVLTEGISDGLVDCVSNANYLIEIPALKGHRWAGVTFFAKNFFGCNTRFSASHMHAGTMRLDYGSPIRSNYKQYRVFVDLLGSKQLGGKTLLFLMDGLWRTSEEHTPPTKFLSSPFNNSYSSSVFASLDPVAIESVCLDVLQKEFTEDDSTVYPVRNSFVQWAGIDDYLHQAASSDWWPNSISYDPDNTGTPIGSLGTHEHWNNTNDMQYSRNLGTGNGIELVTNFATTDIHSTNIATEGNVSPNPCSGNAAVSFNLASGSDVTIILVSATGAIVGTSHHSNLKSGQHKLPLNISGLKSGNYFCVIKPGNQTDRINTIKFVVRPM